MSKEQTSDLLKFLKPFTEDIQELTLWLREFVWDLYPNANELIYDNYNALAFGWSVTDRLGQCFCNIAVGRSSKNVHFGFYWGSKISDPEKRLIGNGNQYRYMIVTDKKKFPKTYMKKLLKEAYSNALIKVKPAAGTGKNKTKIIQGATITKSISPVKRKAAGTTAKKKK